MTRAEKIRALLASGADDTRRLTLDRIDDVARRTNTWGTKEHRDARNKAEQAYDDISSSYEKLSDLELDRALAEI